MDADEGRKVPDKQARIRARGSTAKPIRRRKAKQPPQIERQHAGSKRRGFVDAALTALLPFLLNAVLLVGVVGGVMLVDKWSRPATTSGVPTIKETAAAQGDFSAELLSGVK